jgi:flagellar basal-body rod protein FlgB
MFLAVTPPERVNAMLSKLDRHFAMHATALDLRVTRQQLIATNIANADTPHYKARDIDFKAAFTEALAGRGVTLARTAPGHLPGGQPAPAAQIRYRPEIQSAVDGNTVDMDIERAAFADNAVRYEAGITFLNGRIRGLLDALQPPR